MKIDKDVPLASHSTMGLGGNAAYLCTVSSSDELIESASWAKERNLPVIMIGSGSNIVWRDEGYEGLVIVNNILSYEKSEANDEVYLKVGAGEIWDYVVERSVNDNLTGIEALSLIPGKAGATPVQNVGAYGQDLSQTLVEVEAYDSSTDQLVTLKEDECDFGYRTSRFKTKDHGRFFILSINLKLRRADPKPPFYPNVQAYFDEHQIANPTAQDLRQAVIAIRSAKLPDPKIVKNNGSFFGNPIISQQAFESLQQTYKDIPNWPAGDDIKLPAAWLIEQAGFKDVHDSETGMATWPKQSLVIVNEHANSTADLLRFKQKIVEAVQDKFSVTLEQEPELLPKN
jgi:UDP-N-acetylmuramate dehydrogenase